MTEKNNDPASNEINSLTPEEAKQIILQQQEELSDDQMKIIHEIR